MIDILDGKKLALKIKDKLKKEIEEEKLKKIKLVVIKTNNDDASEIYIRNKKKACEYVGIKFEVKEFKKDTKEEIIIRTIKKLNKDKRVTGILVQLPLANGLSEEKIIGTIDSAKDVDGMHLLNFYKNNYGENTFLPCTPKAVLELLKYYKIDLEGKECVVLGRSKIVGLPLAHLLLNNNATVTVCHSKTKNLKEITKRADILIVAIGKKKLIDKEYIKSGAIVIDVGIHHDGKEICGDVDYESVKNIASAITPVPGGIGPMTIAMLISNCVLAAKKNKN